MADAAVSGSSAATDALGWSRVVDSRAGSCRRGTQRVPPRCDPPDVRPNCDRVLLPRGHLVSEQRLRRFAELGDLRGRPCAPWVGGRAVRAHRTLRSLGLRCGGYAATSVMLALAPLTSGGGVPQNLVFFTSRPEYYCRRRSFSAWLPMGGADGYLGSRCVRSHHSACFGVADSFWQIPLKNSGLGKGLIEPASQRSLLERPQRYAEG
jgi:hypothetical protein